MDDVKTCNRTGCGKTLRSDNKTGVCATNCYSLEAPPAHRHPDAGKPPSEAQPQRAKPVAKKKPEGSAPVAKKEPEGSARERFDVVARALGKDPDAILEEFCEAWLAALAERLEDA